MRKRNIFAISIVFATLLVSCTSTSPQPTPGSVLDLSSWILAIPEGNAESGQPDEMSGEALQSYSSDYFQVDKSRDGVAFRVRAGGFVQEGSLFPRTELRELRYNDVEETHERAFWSNREGVHTLTIREAITRLPQVHPSIVAGQLHDADKYVALVRLDDKHLYVKSNDKNVGTLDESYQLGTPFVVEIKATDGHVEVFYNGKRKVQFKYNCRDCYFKAGAYLQSNDSAEYGDKPDAVGEVVVSGLTVSHH